MSANNLTNAILRVINLTPGCVAYRINNVGVWDEKKQIHRRGNTQKGIADVGSVVWGRALWIEVKFGKDRQTRDQQIFQQEIERAKGLYWLIHDLDQFLEKWQALTQSLNHSITQ